MEYRSLKDLIKKNMTSLVIYSTLFLASFIVLSLLLFNKLQYDKKVLSYDVINSSYVTDEGNKVYSQEYLYKVDGETYYCDSSINTSQPITDNEIYIYYNSSNPGRCDISYDIVFEMFIVLFSLISIVPFVHTVLKIKTEYKDVKKFNKLLKEGVHVRNLSFTFREGSIISNGSQSFLPVVSYKINGIEYEFVGNEYIYNVHKYKDKLIDLVYDADNIENYYLGFDIDKEV